MHVTQAWIGSGLEGASRRAPFHGCKIGDEDSTTEEGNEQPEGAFWGGLKDD